MLTRRGFVLGGTCAAIANSAAASDKSARDFVARVVASDGTATAFVASIYGAYVGRNGNGVSLDDEQTVQRYFEPSLAGLILTDQHEAARRKEVGTLDFDPFVDAQDWDIAAFHIAVSNTGPDKTSATVTFNSFGKPQTVVLDLVKIKNEWKISDITWTPHENPNTLRALYLH